MSAPATKVPAEFPCQNVMVQAAKLAMEQDREIHLDYFKDSFAGKACFGEDPDTKEKILIKVNGEEYTSRISKIYKVDADVIVLTENSIYVVSGKIAKRILGKGMMPKDE